MRITLKANEKLFLNGAVIRADKKVTLELLNDATFLLQSHVLQEEDTTTPLKQLYYAGQMILMNPLNKESNFLIFESMLSRTLVVFSDEEILSSLKKCAFLVEEGRIFEILKIIRSLYDREESLINGTLLRRSV